MIAYTCLLLTLSPVSQVDPLKCIDLRSNVSIRLGNMTPPNAKLIEEHCKLCSVLKKDFTPRFSGRQVQYQSTELGSRLKVPKME